MTRPNLNQHTKADDFLSFYWLKEELISFLREHDLPTSGPKQDLTARIYHFLASGLSENKPSQKSERRTEIMPKTFTRQSVIKAGWRCSQELRTFFEQEIGTYFHFDSCMRDFIRNGAGKSLSEAIETWKKKKQKSIKENPIEPQFEYNQHIRDYFKTHPGAKRQEAIREWKEKKKQRH